MDLAGAFDYIVSLELSCVLTATVGSNRAELGLHPAHVRQSHAEVGPCGARKRSREQTSDNDDPQQHQPKRRKEHSP